MPKRTIPTYYTTDGGRLAPHPGMTDEQLEDFESWAAEREAEAYEAYSRAWKIVLLGLFAYGAYLWLG